jgi:hypothetical protein
LSSRVIFFIHGFLGVLSSSSCHATRGSFARWGTRSWHARPAAHQTSGTRREMDQSSMFVAKCAGNGDLIRQLQYPEWRSEGQQWDSNPLIRHIHRTMNDAARTFTCNVTLWTRSSASNMLSVLRWNAVQGDECRQTSASSRASVMSKNYVRLKGLIGKHAAQCELEEGPEEV